MGYVVQNIHGVIAVNDEATLNEPKEIRFIDPHYNERFKIKDGEQILISYPDGEKKALTCKFIDEYHVIVGHTPYHICQFAECNSHPRHKARRLCHLRSNRGIKRKMSRKPAHKQHNIKKTKA